MSWKYRNAMKKATSAMETGAFQEAETILSSLISSKDEPVEALIHRAYARLCRGQLPDAEADAKRATELRPESGVAFMLLGQIQAAQKNLIAAHASLMQSVSLEKDNGQALFHLGQVCAQLGRKMEAADYFQSALQFERDYVMAQWMADFWAQG